MQLTPLQKFKAEIAYCNLKSLFEEVSKTETKGDATKLFDTLEKAVVNLEAFYLLTK